MDDDSPAGIIAAAVEHAVRQAATLDPDTLAEIISEGVDMGLALSDLAGYAGSVARRDTLVELGAHLCDAATMVDILYDDEHVAPW